MFTLFFANMYKYFKPEISCFCMIHFSLFLFTQVTRKFVILLYKCFRMNSYILCIQIDRQIVYIKQYFSLRKISHHVKYKIECTFAMTKFNIRSVIFEKISINVFWNINKVKKNKSYGNYIDNIRKNLLCLIF